MISKIHLILCGVTATALLTAGAAYAAETQAAEIPGWIKEVAGFWAADQIDDATYTDGIEYLIGEGIIEVDLASGGADADRVGALEDRISYLEEQVGVLTGQYDAGQHYLSVKTDKDTYEQGDIINLAVEFKAAPLTRVDGTNLEVSIDDRYRLGFGIYHAENPSLFRLVDTGVFVDADGNVRGGYGVDYEGMEGFALNGNEHNSILEGSTANCGANALWCQYKVNPTNIAGTYHAYVTVNDAWTAYTPITLR